MGLWIIKGSDFRRRRSLDGGRRIRLANLEYMNLEENITQRAVSYISSVE